MHKSILPLLAATAMAITGCGKTSAAGSGNQAPETGGQPLTEEAVAAQVACVYKYLNVERRYYMETPPESVDPGRWKSADDMFATQEWRETRAKADGSGCVINFGDEGPFDPWRYDCFEGELTPDDIQVTFLPDGTAMADFTLRDVTTANPVPLRWRMRVEGNRWRVADIIFVRNNNASLLDLMKAHLDSSK